MSGFLWTEPGAAEHCAGTCSEEKGQQGGRVPLEPAARVLHTVPTAILLSSVLNKQIFLCFLQVELLGPPNPQSPCQPQATQMQLQ